MSISLNTQVSANAFQTNPSLKPKISKENEALRNQISEIGKTDPEKASLLSRKIVFFNGTQKSLDSLKKENLLVDHFPVSRLLGGMMSSKNDYNILNKIRLKRFAGLASNYRTRIQLPYNNNSDLGCGINPKGDIFPTAILNKGTAEKPNFAQTDQRCWKTVTREENARETEITAELGVSGPCFEISGDLGYMSKAVTDEKSMQSFIAHSYESDFKTVLDGVTLSPEAQSILQDQGLLAFIKMYGTHYVSGYVNAASFFGEIKVLTTSKEEANSVAVKAQAEIGNIAYKVKVGGSYSNTESSLSQSYNMNARASIRGVKVNQVIGTMEQLWEAYGSFIQKLNQKVPPESPYLLICEPWVNLPEVSKIASISDQYNEVEQKAKKEIEYSIFSEVENLLSVCEYKEAADMLLLSQTLSCLPEFINSLVERKKENDLKMLAKYLSESQRGSLIVQKYINLKKPGLSLQGRCSVEQCPDTQKVQNIFVGIGNFDFGKDLFKRSICVKCQSILDVQELLFFDCAYTVIKTVKGSNQIIENKPSNRFESYTVSIGDCEALTIETK